VKTGNRQESALGGSIDENLRKVFDETLEQGVPDRFKMLLDQLKDQDAKQETTK